MFFLVMKMIVNILVEEHNDNCMPDAQRATVEQNTTYLDHHPKLTPTFPISERTSSLSRDADYNNKHLSLPLLAL